MWRRHGFHPRGLCAFWSVPKVRDTLGRTAPDVRRLPWEPVDSSFRPMKRVHSFILFFGVFANFVVFFSFAVLGSNSGQLNTTLSTTCSNWMNEALRRGGNAEQGNSSVGFDQLDFHRNIAIDPPLVLASDLDKLRFSSSLPPLDLNHFSFFLLSLAASLNIVFHFPSLSLLPDGRISNLAPSRREKKNGAQAAITLLTTLMQSSPSSFSAIIITIITV